MRGVASDIPRVRIVLASSIDGKIADYLGRWRPLCPYDERRFLNALRWADAIVVGWRTVAHSRLNFSTGEEGQVRAIIDPRGMLDVNDSFFAQPSKSLVFGYEKTYPESKMRALESRGVEVVLSPNYPIEPSFIASYVATRHGARRILVAGGGLTAWAFLISLPGVELQITLAPVVLGDSVYQNLRAPSLDYPGLKLRLVSARLCKCKQEVVCRYLASGRGTYASSKENNI